MIFGSIKIRTRPVRIAFLVDPTCRADLYRAIELSSSQWGGSYNPIVPAYKRTPKAWNFEIGSKPISPIDIVSGYLNGFEPDIVVPVGICADRTFEVGNRHLVVESDFVGDTDTSFQSNYGIGLHDLIDDCVEQNFKYKRQDDLQIAMPVLPKAHRAFLASIFGTQTENVRSYVKEKYPELPIDTHCSVSLKTMFDDLKPTRIFTRHLTSNSLEYRPLRDATIFVCDATKALDVIDYWNLRAAGTYVIPMPIQLLDSDSAKRFVREFIDDNFKPYPHNADMYPHTTVQKSRSVGRDAIDKVCEPLRGMSPHAAGRRKYSIRCWYPRLWDEWARQNTTENIAFPFSYEGEVKVSSGENRLDFRTADPKIKYSDRFSRNPNFVNELSFNVHDSDEPMAEVMPEGSRELSSAIGRTGYRNWRFSSMGLVYLSCSKGDRIFIDLPRAESIMTEWFRERGWSVSLSAPGRIAKQMYKHLGGKYGVQLLAHAEIINLLSDLEKESGLPRQAVINRLDKIFDEFQMPIDSERHLGSLIEANAMRLGAKIQCPICTRYNWYELNTLEYDLPCRFCLSDFKPPLTSPKNIEWSYRAHGPFATSTAQGSFTVLLTLNLLGGALGPSTTPLFSYSAKKGGRELEADLSLLYKQNSWSDCRTNVVHAECKSFNSFADRDVSRMRDLAVAFPGSILIFATLKNTLSDNERESISALVSSQRLKRLSDTPYSPIVILTGTELFSSQGVTNCWDNLTGIYEEIKKSSFSFSDLSVFADATQQVYLDFQSWHDWSEIERKKG